MKIIKLTHKIHKTDKYIEKMSSKEHWFYLLISTQPTAYFAEHWLFLAIFFPYL